VQCGWILKINFYKLYLKCGKFHNFLNRNFRKEGGFRPFIKGTTSTIIRDVIFGGIFTTIRHKYKIKDKQIKET